MRKKKKVVFEAWKTIKEPVKVKFRTADGRVVSFWGTKTHKEPQKVEFYAKRKKRR